MRKLTEQHLVGETIRLSDDVVNVLGPELVLERCVLELDTSRRALLVLDVTLIDCDIVAKRAIRDSRWRSAFLRRCRVRGEFRDSWFGADPREVEKVAGDVIECDFTHARLNGCTFLACDIESNTLPRWPCFTVLRPFRHREELAALTKPHELAGLWKVLAESTARVSAEALYAPDLAKSLGAKEEEIHAAVSSLPFVVC